MNRRGSFLRFLAYCFGRFLSLFADSLGGLFRFFSNCFSGFLGFFARGFESVLNSLSCFFCSVLYIFYCPFLRQRNKRGCRDQSNNKGSYLSDCLLFIWCLCTNQTDETTSSRASRRAERDRAILLNAAWSACNKCADKSTRVSLMEHRRCKALR